MTLCRLRVPQISGADEIGFLSVWMIIKTGLDWSGLLWSGLVTVLEYSSTSPQCYLFSFFLFPFFFFFSFLFSPSPQTRFPVCPVRVWYQYVSRNLTSMDHPGDLAAGGRGKNLEDEVSSFGIYLRTSYFSFSLFSFFPCFPFPFFSCLRHTLLHFTPLR